jgi:hypothetical protein
MSCPSCGRMSTNIKCSDCTDHDNDQHPSRCPRCMIEALPGWSMKQVRVLNALELIELMHVPPLNSVVWQSIDGRQLVVVPPASNPYRLVRDEHGWCKRSG